MHTHALRSSGASSFHRYRGAVVALLAAALTVSVSAPSAAQGVQTGAIRGVVSDPQDRSVPGVTVTATSPALQSPRTTVTEREGEYELTALPPGDYTVTFALAGFATVSMTTQVPLGRTMIGNASLKVSPISEVVEVLAEAPPSATPVVGANFRQAEIESLATPRSLQGVAQLSPGLNENSPSRNQVVINGAFAFDNIFMINGVDVNDNLRAQPQNLFVEDAIQETQVLTSGISAEYGRFTGGVVQAITKSGGNSLRGSLRVNFFNPAWTDETPFERSKHVERLAKLQENYEATLGGPVVRDRLWFFGAGRHEKSDSSNTLPLTGLPYTQTTANKRGEIKLTGAVAPGHSIQAGYMNNGTNTTNGSGALSFIVDPHALDVVDVPNWYTFGNYRGSVGSSLLVQAQYSERRFTTGGGNTSQDLADSPFFSVLGLGPYIWNAPYFDASDREQRNNRQLTASASKNWMSAGRHDTKAGYEFFRSQRAGGGSQSSTGTVFYADFATTSSGKPVLDASGRLIPVFTPGESAIDSTRATRGAVMNVDTQSLFLQDRWTMGEHWSVDLGLRYEHVKVVSTGNIVGVDNQRIVPRVAAAYDVRQNGNHIVRGTYGMYAGRYNEAQIGGNSPVANAPELLRFYTGPAGQGRDFAPGYDLANYPVTPDNAVVWTPPPSNVVMDPALKSPIVHEATMTYDVAIGKRGRAEASYVYRKTSDLIEDFYTLDSGFTDVSLDGIDAGLATNKMIANTSLAHREYQGLVFQSNTRLAGRWTLNGHYTVQLKNNGNYEGETSALPGAPSLIGDYPEAFDAGRFYPDGRLQSFQRHRLRVWSTHSFKMGGAGDLSLSGLLRLDSGRVYSLVAKVPISSVQKKILAGAGYPDFFTPNSVYFADRGSESFKGYGLFDTSINFNVAALEAVHPWIKLDVFNLFNNQKLISWNTTVKADPNSPVDSLGVPTGYVKGPLFGQATADTNYAGPFGGLTGGRTVRLAVGFRF